MEQKQPNLMQTLKEATDYTQLGGNKLVLWERVTLGKLTLSGIDSGKLAYLTASMYPSLPHEKKPEDTRRDTTP